MCSIKECGTTKLQTKTEQTQKIMLKKKKKIKPRNEHEYKMVFNETKMEKGTKKNFFKKWNK